MAIFKKYDIIIVPTSHESLINKWKAGTIIDMKESIRKSFLKEIKKLVAKNGCIPIPRDKNISFMREHFLDDNDLKEIVLDLIPNDCIDGPEEDRGNYKGYVMEFKSSYLNDILIYIKIRYNPPDEVVIISFHEDE